MQMQLGFNHEPPKQPKIHQFMDMLCKMIDEYGLHPTSEEMAGELKWPTQVYFGCEGRLVRSNYIWKHRDGTIRLHERGIDWFENYRKSPRKPLKTVVKPETVISPQAPKETRQALKQRIEEMEREHQETMNKLAALREQLEQMPLDTRVCQRCNHEKPIEEFGDTENNFQWWCSECRRQNDAFKNEGRRYIRELGKICKKEGGGRLATTFIQELVAELAGHEGAKPFVLGLHKKIKNHNKKIRRD